MACIILAGTAACSGTPAAGADPGQSATLRAGNGGGPATALTAPGLAVRDASPVPGVLGRYWVGQRRFRFTAPARTGPTGQRLGRRGLLTLVRYPLTGRPGPGSHPAAGPFPLIIFAPGFQQCAGPYARLLQAWASAGYVVAAVNFPHSDCLVGAAATEADLVNQPGDVSYVITTLLKLSAARHGLLAGLVNPRQIGVAGHSDGGDTAVADVATTCCTDRRIAAAAVLSGAEWPPMPGRYFARKPVPILFTQGSADPINPASFSIAMYRADPAARRSSWICSARITPSRTGVPTGWSAWSPGSRSPSSTATCSVRRARPGRMRQDGNVPGLAVLVSGRPAPRLTRPRGR